MTCSSAHVKISRDAASAATFSLGWSVGRLPAQRLRSQSPPRASTPVAMTATTPHSPVVVTGVSSASSMAVSSHVSQPTCWIER